MRKRILCTMDERSGVAILHETKLVMTADDDDPWPVEPAEAHPDAPRKRMVMVEMAGDVWQASGRYEWVVPIGILDPKYEERSRPALAPPSTPITRHPPRVQSPASAQALAAAIEPISWAQRQPDFSNISAARSITVGGKAWASDLTVVARAEAIKRLGVTDAQFRRLESNGEITAQPLNPGSKFKYYSEAEVKKLKAKLAKRARRRPA